MHDNSTLIRARIRRFVSERVAPAVYRASAPLVVSAWEVPDEPVRFAEARRQAFTPFAVGRRWGKPWGTTWFHVTGTVPEEWSRWGGLDTRTELLVDLGFLSGQPGFQAEGLVFDPAGNILKGIEPFNSYVPLQLGPGGVVDVYVEADSNPDVGSNWTFRPTPVGDKATAGTEPIYRLRRMDAALLDTRVWQLQQDIWTLFGLMEELGADLPRTADILRALETVTDRMDPDDVSGTAGLGRAILAPVLAQPAYASAHRIVAVGHAHIDAAWLWPVRETIRKCARTFSNVLALMDENPEFIFACSSAQQYAWMKEHYPQLFERMRERVIEGRFVPVGGMWVESDTNMPGGEALARQLIAGKAFFLREFGIEPLEVWLPDSFGYTAAFPQIVAAAGSKYFLTQKISWNETNTMPHHTFYWEGIDGTRVFTHFPPVDTYNSVLSGQDLARAQRQYAEKGASNLSLVPFGYGDGGGGPTREMLAAAERTKSLEGSPTVRMATAAGVLRRGASELPGPAGVVRRALPRIPPRHVHLPRQHEGRQPAERAPAARGRAVGDDGDPAHGGCLPLRPARGGLAHRAGEPVPRHPPRQFHRLGAPGGRGRVRRCAGGAGRPDFPGARRIGGPGCRGVLRRHAGRLQRLAVPGVRGGRPVGRPARDIRGSSRRRPRRRVRARERRDPGRDRRPRTARVPRGPRDRAGGTAGGKAQQRSPALPGHADAVGRVGHRRSLPAQRRRPAGGRLGGAGVAARWTRDRARQSPLRVLDRVPGTDPGRRPDRARDRHHGGLARTAEVPEAGLSAGYARRSGSLRNPVRPHLPAARPSRATASTFRSAT